MPLPDFDSQGDLPPGVQEATLAEIIARFGAGSPDPTRHRGGARMIRNDTELHTAQERILLFERLLAEARKTYSATNYLAMAEGYLMEIDRMRTEIREYLSQLPGPTEAA